MRNTTPRFACAVLGLTALAAAACGSDDGGSGSPDASAQAPDAAAQVSDAAGRALPAPFDPSRPYQPDIPAELSADITNPLFPWPVAGTWSYASEGPDGSETTEISVEQDTFDVNGVAARVVRDTVYLDGELIEDTRDWYAQDADGNVWYLGEDTAEYEGGVVVSTEGSWTWGEGGALPGIVMLGDPQVGDVYRQEYLVDEAEDYGEVVGLDESVTVPAGTFTGCLKTRDRSAIDASVDELKYFCAGVGGVLTEEGAVRDELIEYDLP